MRGLVQAAKRSGLFRKVLPLCPRRGTVPRGLRGAGGGATADSPAASQRSPQRGPGTFEPFDEPLKIETLQHWKLFRRLKLRTGSESGPEKPQTNDPPATSGAGGPVLSAAFHPTQPRSLHRESSLCLSTLHGSPPSRTGHLPHDPVVGRNAGLCPVRQPSPANTPARATDPLPGGRCRGGRRQACFRRPRGRCKLPAILFLPQSARGQENPRLPRRDPASCRGLGAALNRDANAGRTDRYRNFGATVRPGHARAADRRRLETGRPPMPLSSAGQTTEPRAFSACARPTHPATHPRRSSAPAASQTAARTAQPAATRRTRPG